MKERRMVPEPEFDSYYGRPILKEPVWKQPDVPLYLFAGGLAGASALLAEGAALTGRAGLLRVARTAAAAGSTLGSGLLVHDLGRPERFLNMLRVLKITSPLSVGSWILASFSGLSAAAAATEYSGRLRVVGRMAGAGAGVLGPALATYTAVLVADTAVPAWHEAHRELPFVFAGSAAAAAGGLAMVAAPKAEAGPARRMAVIGGVAELAASELMNRRLGMHAEVYREGRPGTLLKLARVLTAAGTGLTPFARRSRVVSTLAGTAYLAGSLLTRFGVFQAGLASARDPKYTVVPQGERSGQ
ncbi:NrfD/PsrC family molybdoenzyme membrane anchor subunit [Kribbella sp. NPDC004875]|uniref:NrfD/PsrC family molybdoenzyme membrane anchor subunit n=1 Tax=Kribbella sp. NPDC004875 TaxID=3364107 RepID=UPI0036A7522E